VHLRCHRMPRTLRYWGWLLSGLRVPPGSDSQGTTFPTTYTSIRGSPLISLHGSLWIRCWRSRCCNAWLVSLFQISGQVLIIFPSRIVSERLTFGIQGNFRSEKTLIVIYAVRLKMLRQVRCVLVVDTRSRSDPNQIDGAPACDSASPKARSGRQITTNHGIQSSSRNFKSQGPVHFIFISYRSSGLSNRVGVESVEAVVMTSTYVSILYIASLTEKTLLAYLVLNRKKAKNA
jgi:hypothetical protein